MVQYNSIAADSAYVAYSNRLLPRRRSIAESYGRAIKGVVVRSIRLPTDSAVRCRAIESYQTDPPDRQELRETGSLLPGFSDAGGLAAGARLTLQTRLS